MAFTHRVTAEEVEMVIAGGNLADPEPVELAAFTRALRSSLTSEAPAFEEADFVARLAETARAGAMAGAPHSENGLGSSSRRARPHRRLALAARVAFAVATVPLLFAGLAFAGVNLPAPAQSVFERVGLELPNQAATTDDDTEGTAHDGVLMAGAATGQENSAGKPGHGKSKSNPARSRGRHGKRGRGHGKQGRGRALGKHGLAPGQSLGAGVPQSNPGGSGGGPSGKPGHGKSKSNPARSRGRGRGNRGQGHGNRGQGHGNRGQGKAK